MSDTVSLSRPGRVLVPNFVLEAAGAVFVNAEAGVDLVKGQTALVRSLSGKPVKVNDDAAPVIVVIHDAEHSVATTVTGPVEVAVVFEETDPVFQQIEAMRALKAKYHRTLRIADFLFYGVWAVAAALIAYIAISYAQNGKAAFDMILPALVGFGICFAAASIFFKKAPDALTKGAPAFGLIRETFGKGPNAHDDDLLVKAVFHQDVSSNAARIIAP